MGSLWFRFHGELNDFLAPRHRDRAFEVAYPHVAAVKDTIESLGVPHPEVEVIVRNGQGVKFSYLSQPDDRFDVYPTITAPTVETHATVQPPPEPRFVLDVHLGRLAEYLRLLGFDTLYRNDYDDEELAAIADEQRRILLTRDLGLLKRGRVIYGRYVRATDPHQQIVEIMRRFGLFDQIAPFCRCSRCNGVLQPVAKAAIADRLLPHTRDQFDEFHQCQQCGQIYWQGSHYAHLQQFIAQVQAAR